MFFIFFHAFVSQGKEWLGIFQKELFSFYLVNVLF